MDAVLYHTLMFRDIIDRILLVKFSSAYVLDLYILFTENYAYQVRYENPPSHPTSLLHT